MCTIMQQQNPSFLCELCKKETVEFGYGVCKPCGKTIRKSVAVLDEKGLTEYRCTHPFTKVHGGASLYTYRRSNEKVCRVCADEIRKETETRNRNAKKRAKVNEATKETLLTKCCKVIAKDPMLVLTAATHDPPIPNHIWEKINEQVPRTLTKEFNEILDASEAANDSKFMYATIGEVFSRYIKRKKGY